MRAVIWLLLFIAISCSPPKRVIYKDAVVQFASYEDLIENAPLIVLGIYQALGQTARIVPNSRYGDLIRIKFAGLIPFANRFRCSDPYEIRETAPRAGAAGAFDGL